MRWERRRSKWPLVAGLCGLFAFTLIAPLLWRHAHLRTSTSVAESRRLKPTPPSVKANAASVVVVDDDLTDWPTGSFQSQRRLAITPPVLPQLRDAEALHALNAALQSGLGEPAIHVSAAFGGTEPKFEEPTREPRAAPSSEARIGPATTTQTEQQSGQPTLPTDLKIIVRSTPAPEMAPERPAFNVQSILEIRDSLAAMLEKVQDWDWPAQVTAPRPQPQPPRVRVESPDDRLAMAIPYESTPTLIAPQEPISNTTTRAQTEDRTTVAPVDRQNERVVPQPIPSRVSKRPPAIASQQENAGGASARKVDPPLRFKPTGLIGQLTAASADGPTAAWADRTLSLIAVLCRTPAADAEEASRAIDGLRAAASEATERATAAADRVERTTWLQLGQAITRRLSVWEILVEPASRVVWRPTARPAQRESIVQSLHEIAALTAGNDEGAKWREFLLLDDIAALASVGADGQTERRRDVARRFLARTSSENLSVAQREFIALQPIDGLRRSVGPWATGPVSLSALSAMIDRYETTMSTRHGDAIYEQLARMRWSGRSDFEKLAASLDETYRVANVRVALSGDLFNRMLPPQGAQTAPVRQRVAGSDVRGQSQTSTELRVRLLPDPKVLRIGLEAYGAVRSHTYSESWPAKVRNVGQMQYEARKLIVVNRHGLHTWPTDAHASGSNRLVDVESQLDPVPIIGSIVQNIAREQHRQRRPLAMRQVSRRVAQQARSRMDEEADAKLQALEDRFLSTVLPQLESLALAAELTEMYTTEQRAVLRLRMASEAQLAAFTPRPSAPSDSLASLQLHESALNNAARGFGLEGRKLDAVELHQTLASKLHRTPAPLPEGVPSRATIQFTEHDAVRIRCHDDRVEVVLSIAELARGRDKIQNVEVHAFFRPIVEDLQVRLVRDGSLQFKGRRLLTAKRVVLHTVFGKLMPKDDEIDMLALQLGSDQRLAGLMVTQLVIDDGWLALAIGPKTEQRVAWRTHDVTGR